MELEELIRSANDGDVNAMNRLEQLQEDLKKMSSNLFEIASAFYDDGKIESAKKMLHGQEEPAAQVLLGLCYMKTRSSDVNKMRYAFEAAYPLLHIVETEEVPDLPVRYQHIALLALSTLYRTAGEIGIQSVPVDINHAYQCVLKASNLPELPEAVRTYTNVELGKYHKKFFCGYYYGG